MKISAVLATLIYIASIPNLFSQDSTKIPLHENAIALQFQIVGDFSLAPFLGSTISGKYHFQDKSAIRFGISLSGATDLSKKVDNKDTLKSTDISIDLTVQYLRYIKTANDLALFIGAGPYFSRSFSQSGYSLDRNDYYTIGISGVLGVEWFFKDNMSLSGEYNLSAYYYDRVNRDYYGTTTSSSGIGVNSLRSVKFGLSVYL